MRGLVLLLVLPLLLSLSCGDGDTCSEEEYDRFAEKHATEGLTPEVEEWIEECADKF
jgi:thiamine pyrophosphokinase